EAAATDRRLAWGVVAGAALVTLAFYREFVFDATRLLAGSDMLLEGYPLRQFYVDEVLSGRGVPLWTPHVYGGMPFVGLLPGPIFYPTTLLYLVQPLTRAIGWTFVIHTFAGGVFAYFMGRSFKLRGWSAAVCGAAFLLTSYVTSHLYGGQDGRMFAMALIPLALGLLERALRSGDFRWYGLLGATVALQIFTPHVQVMYFSSLALASYLVFHLVVRARGEAGSEPAWRRLVRPAAGFAFAFVSAAGLGAVQLFPAFSILSEVTRAAPEQGYAFAASYALPAQELTAFFLPGLLGSLGTYWGTNPLKLHTEYLGVVPLALALFALAASFRSALAIEARRTIWFLWGASALGVLFALGAATPVHRIAYTVLPMISSFRAPSMMLAPVVVFVALLAGFGWDAALAAREGGSRGGTESGEGREQPVSGAVLSLLGVPFLFLGLAALLAPEGLLRFVAVSWLPSGWPRTPSPDAADRLRFGGLVVLLGFGLAWGVALGVARGRLAASGVLVLIAFCVADAWRVSGRYVPVAVAAEHPAVADDRVLRALRDEAEPGERVWACGARCGFDTYGANRFMAEGVSSATGSQKFLLTPYARLVGGFRPDEGLLQIPGLIALLHVRYLVTGVAQSGLEIVAEEPGRFLYEIPGRPHAYFPAQVVPVRDTSEAVRLVRAGPDPRERAVVEVPAARTSPPAGRGAATIVRYEPETIELDVQAESGGLLAISEIHHPYWRAYVDDDETEVWRVDVAFRGVEVPAGARRVRFEYESPAYRAGLATTGLSAMALVGVFGLSVLRTRRRRRVGGMGTPGGG
ncbi:MAG: hypothetical protein MJB57_09875, partial [Gemmatimonadetes bacterium]|nr:hypothetical protein [Gemmatimonadota bacterium]